MGEPYKDLPSTQHSVFYSYAIMINGSNVGSFEKFSVNFTRNAERIREILYTRGARTKEMLWSTTDINLSLDHVELYRESVLQALGYELVTIEDLNTTLNIMEYMYIPNETGPDPDEFKYNEQPDNISGDQRIVVYKDCVVTGITKEVNTGTAKVMESMTLECATVYGTALPTHDPWVASA